MPEAYAPKLYPDDLAERLKAHAGEPYQPSNGDEGDRFMSLWCEKCIRDNLDPDTGAGGCPIIALTMALDTDEEDYPKAWQYGPTGQPVCTEFTAKPPGWDEGLEKGRNEAAAAERRAATYAALPRDPTTGRPVI